MNMKIPIVILIVAVVAILGVLVFSNVGNASVDTQINFLSNSTLDSGDNVTFELRDAQGNALANKTVNIKYIKDGESQTFTITTDSEGKGYLTLANEKAGSCEVIVSFDGDDKYNSCTASQSITINGDTSVNTSQNTQQNSSSKSTSKSTNSSSSSNLHYDSELNVKYDDNGVIKGGQSDGMDYESVKNNPQQVDEEGNLV